MRQVGQVEMKLDVDIMTGEETWHEYIVTQADVDMENAQNKETERQAINTRLKEIDNEVCQARVIKDILDGKPINKRVTDALTERDTLIARLNDLGV